MKKIVEEWKTIAEFPDYEISNFGRCRHKEDGRILKMLTRIRKDCNLVSSSYIFRNVRVNGRLVRLRERSPGTLVARAFVENPNGYKFVRYIDGDSTNAMFTNLKWVKHYIDIDLVQVKMDYLAKNIVTSDDQLRRVREKLKTAVRFEKALSEGRVADFISGDLNDLCTEIVNRKFIKKDRDFKLELIREALDDVSYRIYNGNAIINFDFLIRGIIMDTLRKRHHAAEFDERRELAL
jgi:hypothetical protein